MTKTNETFSAFIDAELTTAESNEQISDASQDVNLQYRMRRYHLIGDIMRQEAGDNIQLDFAAKISAEIAQLEPLVKPSHVKVDTAESVSIFSRWFKPLSGFAVAASVAWVAVISLQSLVNVDSRTGVLTQKANEIALTAPQVDVSEQVNQLAQLPVISNIVSVSAPVLTQSNPNNMHWSSAQSQAVSQAKLNAYLVTHTEYSTSMQGMIPQARVAGFDVNP